MFLSDSRSIILLRSVFDVSATGIIPGRILPFCFGDLGILLILAYRVAQFQENFRSSHLISSVEMLGYEIRFMVYNRLMRGAWRRMR